MFKCECVFLGNVFTVTIAVFNSLITEEAHCWCLLSFLGTHKNLHSINIHAAFLFLYIVHCMSLYGESVLNSGW